MKKIKHAVKREHKEFVSAVMRARQLFDWISKGQLYVDGNYRGVGNPERRDIAQFLFLDVASQWEAFCTSVFELELKRRYNVQPNVALRITPPYAKRLG